MTYDQALEHLTSGLCAAGLIAAAVVAYGVVKLLSAKRGRLC